MENINGFFIDRIPEERPIVNGLVLAGGKSKRMGTDKSILRFHDKEQRYHLADTLQRFVKDVFISCRPDQTASVCLNYKLVQDSFTDLGPYGALLSAFREQPDAAWLVIACDFVLVDDNCISYLLENRNSSQIATAYKNPDDGLPEPLITLWEPKSYAILLSFLAKGSSSLRGVLIKNKTTLLEPPDPEVLTNVNTMEELQAVKEKILQRKKYNS